MLAIVFCFDAYNREAERKKAEKVASKAQEAKISEITSRVELSEGPAAPRRD